MEGLIPFVYKSIVQYRNGGRGVLIGGESPSGSYVKLRGDSGRFQFQSEGGSATPPKPSSSCLGLGAAAAGRGVK
uniref:Uncharacterized protein n=1 Tax=Kalanchoe fedtschenkoi TaxID=63787 RepID=A0A7N0TAN7_KALFE